MATYVNDLRLKEIATGDESGTWGTSTNTNLELIAEAFSFGTEAITTNADTHTTTIADGSTDPGRSIFLKYTGTLDSACTITIGPNTVSKLWFIENATSGSQSIIIKQGSGATITVPNGQTKAIYSDGAGSGAAMVDAFQDLSIPDLFIDDDLTFTSDSAVITFGADGDTTLTHTDGSGLTLNSTNKLMFNDASQFIQGSSATVLSLGATDEIDLTATAIDVNGTIDVSGNATFGAGIDVTGDITLGDSNPVITFNDSSVTNLSHTISSSSDNLKITVDANGVDSGSRVEIFDGTTDVARFAAGATIFNEGSADIDFRVESNGNTHMLFIDGGNDRLMVGKSSTGLANQGVEFEDGQIKGTATGQTVAFLNRASDDGTVLDLRKDNTTFGTISKSSTRFTIEGPDNPVRIVTGTSNIQINHDTHITFDTAGSERVRVNTSEMVINEDSNNYDFRVESDGNSHMLFVDAAADTVVIGSGSITAPSTVDFLSYASSAAGRSAFVHGSGDGGVVLSGTGSGSAASLIFGNDWGSDGSGFTEEYRLIMDGSDDSLKFKYNANASTALTLSSAGKVGIGVTDPTELVHLQGDGADLLITDAGGGQTAKIGATGSNNGIIELNNSSHTSTVVLNTSGDSYLNGGNIGIGTTSPTFNMTIFGSGNTFLQLSQSGDAVAGHLLGRSSSKDLRIQNSENANTVFWTNNIERLRLTADGDLGLGTSSPVSNSGYGGLTLNGTSGSIFSLMHNGTEKGRIVGGSSSLSIQYPSDGVLTFFDGVSGGAERARFDADGDFLKDCSSAPSASVPGFAVRNLTHGWIHTSYDSTSIRTHHNFFNPNGSVGTITTAGSATQYNTSSDQRLKENIQDAEDAGALIDAIQVRQFDWKADGSHQRFGMVAQELTTVAPEAVSTPEDPDEMMGVDYSKLVPMLIKEIQTLRSRVAELEK